MLNKKGAMFGLDTRIALAIFGALSVISGAALYSAIQQANATKLFVTSQEAAKAMEAYYLDTGSQVPNQSGANRIYIGNITKNFANNDYWNGPYFGNDIYNNQNSIYLNNFVKGEQNEELNAYSLSTSDWTGTVLTDATTKGCSAGDCSAYLQSTSNTSTYSKVLSSYNLLDQNIDNGDGPIKGKIRATEAVANTIRLYIQLTPYKE